MMIHEMVTSKYFDLAISAVIGLNVITMAMEFYMMPMVQGFLLCALHLKLSSFVLVAFPDIGVRFEGVQLLLYGRLHSGGRDEGLRPRLRALHA